MRRPARIASAALLAAAAAAAAAPASARVTELGQIAQPVQGSCPGVDTCSVVTRTTGYQVRAGGIEAPVTVPGDGRIVAFTLYLGDPTAKEIAYFDGRYGGTSRVRVTILRKEPHRRLVRRVMAQSGVYLIEPHFGTSPQFALGASLKVLKGDIVAMSVPTWAPMLAFNLARNNAWRASRPGGGCADFESLTAQFTLQSLATYGCTYTEARLAYSVTFVSKPRQKYDAKHRLRKPAPSP